MQRPPRQQRPSRQGIPIIGLKKFNEDFSIEFGPVKLHPPCAPDGTVAPAWIMQMSQLVSCNKQGLGILALFGFQQLAFVAEDATVGGKLYKKHAPVMLMPQADGTVNVALVEAPPGSVKH